MIILNEYSITSDGKWLTIDVKANPTLTGVYLSALKVSCTGSFSTEDSSVRYFNNLIDEAINEYTGEVIDWEDCPTQIRIKLDATIGNKPFYLYVAATDPLQVVTTCAHKSALTAITFNKYPIYQQIACSAHELNVQGCEPPLHFIDYLMKLKALEASIAVGDSESINYYFDWLVLNGETGYTSNSSQSVSPLNSGCGCHG